MKKIAVICLSLVMLFSISMTAFAAPGIFVSSPSGNPAPELVEVVNKTDACPAKIKITAYSERATLDAADREKIESAYTQIVNADSDNAFSKVLATLAKNNKMSVSSLSVSDLFDISYYNCENHEGHEGFTITLKADTIDQFVGMLHLNGEEWELVKVNNVDEDKNTVTFFVEELSPFAIVVDNGTGSVPPQTGDTSMIYLWVMLATASGLALVLVCMKKQKA